jgi:hypothetical protein
VARSLTREELYALVWSEPMKQLAPRFGVSDVALAKTCHRVQIPLPKPGYWTRHRAGKLWPQELLPLRPPGMSDTVTVGRESYWNNLNQVALEQEILETVPSGPSFPEEISAVRERVRQIIKEVNIHYTLDQPHRLIARILEKDESRREKQRTTSYTWDNPIFDSAIEQRRLRILNSLFLVVEGVACKPSIRGREGRELSVQVGQQYVGFMLDRVQENGRSTQRNRTKTKRESDKLRLELKSSIDSEKIRVSWKDNGVKTLEKQIKEIAIEIIVNGEIQHRQSAQRLYEWKRERKAQLEKEIQQRKAEQEHREQERQIRLQRERVERLLAEATSLRQANEIRAYVEAVRSVNLATNNPVPSDQFIAWADWALTQADRIDPIITGTFYKDRSKIE